MSVNVTLDKYARFLLVCINLVSKPSIAILFVTKVDLGSALSKGSTWYNQKVSLLLLSQALASSNC